MQNLDFDRTVIEQAQNRLTHNRNTFVLFFRLLPYHNANVHVHLTGSGLTS
jgi:hypothetical protein